MVSSSTPRHPRPSAGKLLLSFLVLSATPVAANPPPLEANLLVPDFSPNIPVSPGPFLGSGPGERNTLREGDHDFSLRHILHHGTHKFPGLLRQLDIHSSTLVATELNPALHPPSSYRLSSRIKRATRLAPPYRTRDVIEAHLLAKRRRQASIFGAQAWIDEPLTQPNVTDKLTILSLAKIAADAYVEVEGEGDWLEVGAPWNKTDDFGWDEDTLRGHIFADADNSTVIIGLKGTSSAVFDGADTTTNDKVNDNLLFSCCCARLNVAWTTVCDCYSGTYTCNSVCLKDALLEESRYYRATLNLYYHVTTLYPSAQIWVVGHSLGGALSSLLGQTYGLPVVAFEAPGEAMAADRIGLELPAGERRQTDKMPIYHFGHTADPVYMGSCTGITSLCQMGGYAMESKCHAGMECTYNTVIDLGWRMGLGYHRIQSVIRDVIMKYDDVPECIASDEICEDCSMWKMITGNETSTTSTSKTTTTTTTTTCTTPGWWGCRDPITTTTGRTTTATITTTSCIKYGWFGNCLDDITTTTVVSPTTTVKPPPVTTDPRSNPTATETCTHKGWFGGCLDPEPIDDPWSSPIQTPSPTSAPAHTTPAITAAPTPIPALPSPTRTSSSCKTPGRLWGCNDYKATATPTPNKEGEVEWKCKHRALLGVGWCVEYEPTARADAGEL